MKCMPPPYILTFIDLCNVILFLCLTLGKNKGKYLVRRNLAKKTFFLPSIAPPTRCCVVHVNSIILVKGDMKPNKVDVKVFLPFKESIKLTCHGYQKLDKL